MRIKELLEALKPSEYRPLMKLRDKDAYKDIFQKFPDTDRNAYRVYLPIDAPKNFNVVVPYRIKSFLNSLDYDIVDYVKGIARRGDRTMRIGKLLTPELQKVFQEDPQRRATKNEYMAVISRHPYDIGAMSTRRGWHSCMDLENGLNKRYIPDEVKNGTFVAYMIKTTDRNIKNPVGRVAIKPLINGEGDIHWVVEDQVYGSVNVEFTKVISKWVDEVNSFSEATGMFYLAPGSYPDSSEVSDIKIKGLSAVRYKQLFDVNRNPNNIQKYDTPSEELQLAAVSQNGTSIKFIENPTYQVMKVAVSRNGNAIRYIDDPTEELQLLAINNEEESIGYIKNPTEKVQILVIEDDAENLRALRNPTEKVKKLAVSLDGNVIEYIENPSEDLQRIAVRNNPTSIQNIIDPTEEIQILAVSLAPHAFRYIDEPTEKVQLLAVGIDGRLIHEINDPSEEVQKKAIDNDYLAIRHIRDPSIDIQKYAVQKNPEMINHISYPAEEAILLAVKLDPTVLRFFDKVSDKVKALASKVLKDMEQQG